MGALKITAQPAIEPVTLAEAKLHFRVDHSVDDALIAGLALASRANVEEYTGRALITQTQRWTLDRFPCRPYLLVPVAPLQSVTEIRTFDEDDEVGTVFAADKYIVDISSEPARIVLKRNEVWPSDLARAGGVRITLVAGYGATAASVPEMLKLAIKMLANTWYDNRETMTTHNLKEVPGGMDSLLAGFRAWNEFGHACVSQEGAK